MKVLNPENGVRLVDRIRSDLQHAEFLNGVTASQSLFTWGEMLAELSRLRGIRLLLSPIAFADDVAKTNLTAILDQYRDDDGHPRIAKIRSL